MLSSEYQELVKQSADFRPESIDEIEHFFKLAKLWKTLSTNLVVYNKLLKSEIEIVRLETEEFEKNYPEFIQTVKDIFFDYVVNLIDLPIVPNVKKEEIKKLLRLENDRLNEAKESYSQNEYNCTLLEIIKNNCDKHLYENTQEISDYFVSLCQELEFKIKGHEEQALTLQTQLSSIDDKTKTETRPIYTHIHSTDFHGSAASFVSSLVDSGVAEFVPEGPEIIYFNISTNNTYKTLSEANSSCEDKRDIIPIFNLEPNPKFDGAYTYGGDIIDRDPYSVNLYCSMLNLVMKGQINEKNVSYLIGNHEGMVICGEFKSAILNGFNTCYSKETESDIYILKKLQKNLKQAVVEEKIKMCCQIPTTNTIVSHVVYTRDNLIAMLDKIIKPFSNAEEHLSEFILSEYFNGVAQGYLDTLKKYLIDNHKAIIELREKLVSMDNNDKILLNQEEILQLSHIVNLFGKIYFLTTTQEIEETLSNIMSASGIEYTYDSFTEAVSNPSTSIKAISVPNDGKKTLGLLWKRSLITTGLKTTEVNTNYKKVNGVLFVVGHDAYAMPEVLRSENAIYCDTVQCKFFRQSCFGLENSSATFFATTGDGEYKRTTLVPEILQPFNVVKEMENIIETGKSEIETVKTMVAQKKVETQNIRE